MAAQGDESVAVATVAGVVSFRGKVIEGMSVSKGTPLVTLSSKNMADGDPVERARIAYEVSKKEYERMKALVGNKIVSESIGLALKRISSVNYYLSTGIVRCCDFLPLIILIESKLISTG